MGIIVLTGAAALQCQHWCQSCWTGNAIMALVYNSISAIASTTNIAVNKECLNMSVVNV